MRLLFVCLGNICRSPTAEAVFAQMAAQSMPEVSFEVDSAGTANYHVGAPPDERSQIAAQRRGYDLSALRARAVRDADFAHYDLILAMDEANLAALTARCPPDYRDRLRLFMDYAPDSGVTAVPDPYYGDAAGFDRVIDLVESAATGLLKTLASPSS